MRRFDALELSGIRKLRPGLPAEADHHPGRMRRSAKKSAARLITPELRFLGITTE